MPPIPSLLRRRVPAAGPPAGAAVSGPECPAPAPRASPASVPGAGNRAGASADAPAEPVETSVLSLTRGPSQGRGAGCLAAGASAVIARLIGRALSCLSCVSCVRRADQARFPPPRASLCSRLSRLVTGPAGPRHAARGTVNDPRSLPLLAGEGVQRVNSSGEVLAALGYCAGLAVSGRAHDPAR